MWVNMRCPVDNGMLEPINEKVGAFQCSACEGIFCINEKVAHKVMGDGISTSKIRPFSYPELHCAKCNAIMENLTLNGVGVDVCAICNAIWFDKGEVEKINKNLTAEEMEDLKKVRWDTTPLDVIGFILERRPMGYW